MVDGVRMFFVFCRSAVSKKKRIFSYSLLMAAASGEDTEKQFHFVIKGSDSD